MSRFAVTFSIDTGELNQPFQHLTAPKSAKRLMQTTKGLPKRQFVSQRVPTALPEREKFSDIIRKQEEALMKFRAAKNKSAIRPKLAEQLRSQIRSSAYTQGTSSPSKREDFSKVLERQKKGLNALREAENEAMEKKRKERKSRLSQKKGDMAKDLARELSKKETKEELEQRELDEHKIKLQKQKDVVDLWNTIISYIDKKKDRTLLDKTEFPMELKKEITGDIEKKYKYLDNKGKETPEETENFNYFDKFHPENQRKFSERRLEYKDSDLPTILDPEPEVDFYLEFDKDNVNNIKSMCLRLRNHVSTNRPIDYYWLYIEATPLKDGKKAGESKYESFYTFETKLNLFDRILASRIHRNNVLLRQKQEQAQEQAQEQTELPASGRKKKKTRGKGDGKVKGRGSVKRKRSKRR